MTKKPKKSLLTFIRLHPRVSLHYIRTALIIILSLLIIERSFKIYSLEASYHREAIRTDAYKAMIEELLEVIESGKEPNYLNKKRE